MADVTNYTIENASGANVRTDLNNVFAAIQSSNSKSSDLSASQCVTGMFFLNTSSDTLKIRNSSNNGFTDIGNIDQANLGLLSRSGGTMNGQLLIDDSSSASTPALSFDSDTDLGLFREASNRMGFSSGGTQQMQFDGNGITLHDQNEIRFREASSNGTHHIRLRAPDSVGANRLLTLPDETGTLLTSSGGVATSLLSGTLITIGDTTLSRGNTLVELTGMEDIVPESNNSHDLGKSSKRWRNLFTNDLNLSNEGNSNDVDGTWGSYTIQEGEESLFLVNKRNGKKYKFLLEEVS